MAPLRASQITTAWRASWGAALQPSPSPADLPPGTTLSRCISSCVAGHRLRIELSNRFGPAPLTISAQVRTGGIEHRTKFAGLSEFTIPTGAVALSDSIAIPIVAGQEIEVVITLPAGGTIHDIERTSSRDGAILHQPGGEPQPALAGALSTLDLIAEAGPTFAVLGDTKSARPNSWVDRVAELAEGRISMVNRSVFGGKLALGNDPSNGLARFDHDILSTAGLTGAIIFCGNNDLIQPGMIGSRGTPILDPALMQSEGQLRSLLSQAALRAKSAGLLAIGATWTPYENVTIAEGYSSPEKMALRASLNAWMRTSGTFDRILDFDAALRDPERHSRLDPQYDAGNHFSPNEDGVERMAQLATNLLTGLPVSGN